VKIIAVGVFAKTFSSSLELSQNLKLETQRTWCRIL
jgi:hypothetical protein